MRLVIPDKDRERAMYGLKEKALARFFIKILQIDRNSDDGFKLTHWKVPAPGETKSAGDFPSCCYDVLSKRPMLVQPGSMTIEEVNKQLDELSAGHKEEDQLPILADFYQRMNAEELTWLIRIILRQMKVGATEKTVLDVFHPDASALFNVSSSLRRVCWDLFSPMIRLESEDRGVVHLMECFQPQLANFQPKSYSKLFAQMHLSDDDKEFWIEDKLDGERMQLHMVSDPIVPGGKRFAFWSRKAKEYTYLYGSGLEDSNSALTQHLKPAFADGVESIILDGEMITWDAELDIVMPFGTLKTAALAEQRNPFAGKSRPLYKVFDILYLNNVPLTRYTLRDRRRALERSMKTVHRRLELHEYHVGTTERDVEEALRNVVETASEGLVIKNPRSMYRLNDRNDDWMKMKPEYMAEFGESLDCLVVGGYYGSGHRGGTLSSFLCGLRVDKSWAKQGEWHEDLFWSFFKVGGGMTRNDYEVIRTSTEGKWQKYDPRRPPTQYIELAGGDLQCERPDVWIKPQDSIVFEVKAAQIVLSDTFRVGKTLRFPRFTRIRSDKDWKSALSIELLIKVSKDAEEKRKANSFKIDQSRREKRQKVTAAGQYKSKPLRMVGYGGIDVKPDQTETAEQKSQAFRGIIFYIMTDSTLPEKKTKPQLEEMVKANGGRIVQTQTATDNLVCIAERRNVKVASLIKRGGINIFRPTWIFDCIAQNRVDLARGLDEMSLPQEMERHVFHLGVEEDQKWFEDATDKYSDSFARDTAVEELKQTMEKMSWVNPKNGEVHVKGRAEKVVTAIDSDSASDCAPAYMFRGLRIYFDDQSEPEPAKLVRCIAQFAGAVLSSEPLDEQTTHIVSFRNSDVKRLRRQTSTLKAMPRVVKPEWIDECWREGTRLDEERFAP